MIAECERLGLAVRPVETWADVERLRLIRNACRDGFSHDTGVVEPEDQTRWWEANRAQVKVWLYWRGLALIGYGLLRQADGRWWSSVAVLPRHAGNGYGGAITADLVRRHDSTVYATARLDNPAAMRLHRAADWEEVGRDDRLAHYQTREHLEVLDEWSQHGWVVQ